MAKTMSKPVKPDANPVAEQNAALDAMVAGAATADVGKGKPASKAAPEGAKAETRFTLPLPGPLCRRVDAQAEAVGLSRLAWIKAAIAEKLSRDGG